jgi:hypothetical protein
MESYKKAVYFPKFSCSSICRYAELRSSDERYLAPSNLCSNSCKGGVLSSSGTVNWFTLCASTQILGFLPSLGTPVKGLKTSKFEYLYSTIAVSLSYPEFGVSFFEYLYDISSWLAWTIRSVLYTHFLKLTFYIIIHCISGHFYTRC